MLRCCDRRHRVEEGWASLTEGIQATKQYEIRTSKSTLDYYRIGLLVYCKFKYTSFSKLHRRVVSATVTCKVTVTWCGPCSS